MKVVHLKFLKRFNITIKSAKMPDMSGDLLTAVTQMAAGRFRMPLSRAICVSGQVLQPFSMLRRCFAIARQSTFALSMGYQA
jgi:hypothetical protein